MSECKILQADCVEAMKAMADCSIDAIVTDPPYGLEFMGASWDKLSDDPVSRSWDTKGRTMTNAPDRDPDTPGGRHGAQTSAKPNPRCLKCGRAVNGRDTAKGFKVCQCEDRSVYLPNTYAVKMQAWHEQWAREAFHVLKPGGYLLAFGGTRTYHRMACAIEDAGFEIRDEVDFWYDADEQFAAFFDSLTPAQQDGLRRVSGSPHLSWLYGSGFPKSKNVGGGRGTALKPAHEPIVVARKPLSEPNVAANVERHGTGAINIDGCRIGTAAADDYGRSTTKADGTLSLNRSEGYGLAGRPYTPSASGRWPANVILDEEAAEALNAQSGECKSGGSGTSRSGTMGYHGGSKGFTIGRVLEASNGGASRFFYTAKASKSERGEGNTHPTVKPVSLMRYLCRLVTPPGGFILDPFCGSGTTGIAAVKEGFNFVGIEREAEYVEIARRRIEECLKARPLFAEAVA